MSCPGFWLTPQTLENDRASCPDFTCARRSLRRDPAGGKFLATALVRLDDGKVLIGSGDSGSQGACWAAERPNL